jgi:phage terminase large subunit GpA-like protein
VLSEFDSFGSLVGRHLIIEDDRPASEWGTCLTIPNSARSSRLDISTTPHLREPIDMIADNAVKEAVLMMPIGAGKTTVFDVHVPRIIKEDPGSILLTMQTDADADDYFDERLEPIMLSVPSIRSMVDSLPRNKRRKGEWVFPHLTLYCKGAKLSAYQRKSVRWVFLDEAWMMKHGFIAEAKGRTHRRWNARVVIVSQGGWTHVPHNGQMRESELDLAWQHTDRREYSITCPDCGHVQPWKLASLKWETQYSATGELDELAVLQSAKYQCAGECKISFADKIDVRRDLSTGSVYVPSNITTALPGHVGWHCNSLALYWQAWGETALKAARANEAKKIGDREPLRIFIQKELAENWKQESDSPEVILRAADYSLADYIDGATWEGETFRFMTIDRQRDHFWFVIRAWRNDGGSRLISCGRLETIEMCRETQLRNKVPEKLTFEDAQHEPGQVYDDCAKYGWTALHGSKYPNFTHHPPNRRPISKLFSPMKIADAPTQNGKARYVILATDKIKDQLASLIGGRGPIFESGKDSGAEYEKQMRSETKREIIDQKTKQIAMRWAKIHSRFPNHMWDCEVYQVAAALMLKILKGVEHEYKSETEAANAAEVDAPE